MIVFDTRSLGLRSKLSLLMMAAMEPAHWVGCGLSRGDNRPLTARSNEDGGLGKFSVGRDRHADRHHYRLGSRPDEASGAVAWLVGWMDWKPRGLAIVAGIVPFPVILFGYLAVVAEIGNLWPISMLVQAAIAAIAFLPACMIGWFYSGGACARLPVTRNAESK